MGVSGKWRAALIAVLWGGAAAAQQPSAILRAVQAHDWTNADILAVQEPDAIAVKLVQFQRLLLPGEAQAGELQKFMAANPSWPEQAVLRRRLNDALAQDQDDGEVRRLCAAMHPAADTALLRCAVAERAGGAAALAQDFARAAWVAGIVGAAEETDFLKDWSASIRPEDDWKRFDALAWSGQNAAADRQLARLDADRRALGAARLALRRGGAGADAAVQAVPVALRNDPALFLDQARFKRGQNDLPAALALWRAGGAAAEAAAPADRRPAFWSERDRLARLLLAAGDAAGAWFLADDALVGTDQAPDALFLAGWVALQKLHDSAKASDKFKKLAAHSPSLITQGRAWYWLGRAAASDAEAKGDFARAAGYPTTFYGQQAIGRLGGEVAPRILALRDPDASAAQAAAFDAADLVRAARLLARWGDTGQARLFLLRQAQAMSDAATLVLAARAAPAIGAPDVAVAVARIAGRQGIALPRLGWPVPFRPQGDVDVPLLLGLMRQESSFDPAVVSAAGAVGLMQLMPDTARQVGGTVAELTDAAANMRLGIKYFQGLLAQFGGQAPYAVAAYNAGPHRVHAWISANGDGLATGRNDDMIDWIEQIPFAETRNYVQRVLENRAVYTADLAP